MGTGARLHHASGTSHASGASLTAFCALPCKEKCCACKNDHCRACSCHDFFLLIHLRLVHLLYFLLRYMRLPRRITTSTIMPATRKLHPAI